MTLYVTDVAPDTLLDALLCGTPEPRRTEIANEMRARRAFRLSPAGRIPREDLREHLRKAPLSFMWPRGIA